MQGNDGTTIDEEGMEFRNLKQVREEARRSLAEFARDEVAARNDDPREGLAIAVRDELGPVLKVRITFETVWRGAVKLRQTAFTELPDPGCATRPSRQLPSGHRARSYRSWRI